MKLLSIPRRALGWLTRPRKTLGAKMAQASAWIVILRMSERILSTIKTVILARILAPDDFGLFGVALIILTAIDYFTLRGTDSALVRIKGDIKPYLDTAWTIQAARGLVVSAVLVAFAPTFASLFDMPGLTNVLRVVAITVGVNSLRNVGIIHMVRELDFGRRFLLQISATFTGAIVGIALAIIFQNVWALVVGELAARSIRTAVSYTIHPHWPRPSINRARMKEMASFGRWIFGANVVNYLTEQVDKLVVSKVLSVSQLGFYTMANQTVAMTVSQAATVVNGVAFPAFSRLQDERDRLKRAYLRVTQGTCLVAFPIAAMILASAPLAVHVVLGDKWLPMVGAFEVLAIWAALRSMVSNQGSVLMAVNRPNVFFGVILLGFVFAAAAMYPFVKIWKLEGAAYAVLISAAVMLPVQLLINLRELKVTIGEFIKHVSVPAISAAFLFVAVKTADGLTDLSISPLTLGIFSAIGIATYLLSIYLMDSLVKTGIRTQLVRLAFAR